MTIFAYKAMDPAGRLISGRMEAVNAVDLEMRLQRMDLSFINGQPVRQGLFESGGVPRRELINYCFHLEQLMRSGVPVLEGLADLRDSLSHPRFREVVASIIESIAGGRTLSQAMGEHPAVFDHVFVSLISAGEQSGRMPEVLTGLVESLKWQDELASQAKKLAMYPAFLGVVVGSVTFFMMLYLVPRMAGFIKSMGKQIPPHTKALMATSDFLLDYWPVVLGLPLLAAAGTFVAIRVSSTARRRFDGLKLNLPVLGEILRKIILARFAGTFALMYSSGISVVEALRITENVVGNVVIRQGLEEVGLAIAEGRGITAAFQSVDLFPPLVTRMLRVGENSGAIDTALLNVSYFYNRDVRESIEKMQTMIEPAMTLLVGVILGWVMLSVLGPIYDVITQLKY